MVTPTLLGGTTADTIFKPLDMADSKVHVIGLGLLDTPNWDPTEKDVGRYIIN